MISSLHQCKKQYLKSESVSIYSKPYLPILLTVSNNISQKNVIRRVKSVMACIIETLEH